MTIFKVDPDQSSLIEKVPQNIHEYTYDGGTLKIRPGNMIYIGPNLKGEKK